ncbi:MAG: STAS domain-containing protein [Nitrospirota bacterium]
MLRITRRDEAGTAVIQVEGKLAGPWVKELEDSWRSVEGEQGRKVLVDLTAVSFIDETGEELLRTMHRERVGLKARGCFTTCLIQTIQEAIGRAKLRQ